MGEAPPLPGMLDCMREAARGSRMCKDPWIELHGTDHVCSS